MCSGMLMPFLEYWNWVWNMGMKSLFVADPFVFLQAYSGGEA